MRAPRPVSDLDVYVDHAPTFEATRSYVLNRALTSFRPAGLAYRVYDRADVEPTAGVAFAHVDLTDVPPRHLPTAGRYAWVVNGRATSISRTRYSRASLTRASEWRGAVIVKTVLNHRGKPEYRYRRRTDPEFRWTQRFLRLLGHSARRSHCPEYGLYPGLADVPERVWGDPSRIVEKFLPGSLALPVVKFRYDFFFDVVLHTRAVFDSLLADPESVREVSVVRDVPAEVRRVRTHLALDFGAIDYFVADGEAVVVDANKTTTWTDDWAPRFPFVARHLDEVGSRLVDVARAGSLPEGAVPVPIGDPAR